MIAANELRIGNWVSIDGKPLRFKGMLEDMVFLDLYEVGKGVCVSNYQDIHPIPLTPEILSFNAGFTENKLGNLFKRISRYNEMKKDYSIVKEFTIKPYFMDKNKFYAYGKVIHSLHELQNIYFALTSEELQIKGL